MATYSIKSGDTASKIAQQYGTTVAALQAANPQYSQFVNNPNYIQAGWNLNLPSSSPSAPTGYNPTTGIPLAPSYVAANPTVVKPVTENINSGVIPTLLIDNTSNSANWQIPETKIPEPDTSTTNGVVAKMKEEIANNDAAQKKIDEEIAKLTTEGEANKKSWLSMISGENKIDVAAKRAELEKQYGVESVEYLAKRKTELAEVEALQNSYNTAVAARDLSLSAEQDRMATQGIITSRMTRMERDANIRLNQMSANINTKLGIMEMEKGNFTEAQSLISQGVDDYTAQYKWEYEVTKDFMDTNYNIIKGLKQDQKDVLNNTLELKKSQWELQLNQTNAVGELMLKYSNAGIKISDSLEEATRKASLVAPLSTETSKAIIIDANSNLNELLSYVQAHQSEGWANVAQQLKGKGVPIQTGSLADVALNTTFGNATLKENKTAETSGGTSADDIWNLF